MSARKRRIKRKIAMLVRLDVSLFAPRYLTAPTEYVSFNNKGVVLTALIVKLNRMGYQARWQAALHASRVARGLE